MYLNYKKTNNIKMDFCSKILIVIFCMLSFGAMSQPLTEATYEMKERFAEELTASSAYYNALDVYKELYQESQDPLIVRNMAHLNYKLRDFERAEKWYEKMWDKPEKYQPIQIDTFHYARLLKMSRNYEKAFGLFNSYIALSSNDSLVQIAENEMVGMDMAKGLDVPKDIFVDAIDKTINSALTDMAPVLSEDGFLYYATFNRKSKITIDADADNFHMKIYKSKKGNDGEYEKATKLSKKINREDYHTGNVTFSKDGRTMYFTRSRLEGDSVTYSKIYRSTFNEDKWEGAVEVEGVNGDWIATHPMMGELFGDEVMYLTSNMAGGYGGSDIYYATKQNNGSFTIPTNLGEKINTSGNEITPYYNEGDLYFSSDTRPGVGGFDVFKTTWNGSEWSAVKNMGLSYNTSYDDFDFTWDARNKKGYIVSNRPYEGKKSSKSITCCDDIFEVNQQDVAVNALVKVFDENDKPLNGAKVIISEIRKGEPVVVDSKTNPEGNEIDVPLKVNKQYKIVIERVGFEPDSFEVNTVGLNEETTYDKKFKLTAKPKEPEFETVTINETIRLNNIYYDFNDDKILQQSEVDLLFIKELMDQYPTMKIELSSHTDAQGKDSYNEGLSQRRANSAKRFLLTKGVAPSRIVAKGYGEAQILNHCTNGVPCTDDEHRFNRRTEFKIIEGPTSIQIKKRVNLNTGSNPTGEVEIKKKR